MKARLWTIALSLLVGCAYHPAPVRLEGVHADLAALGGRWIGEYSSEQSGRNGTILFQLVASRDSAYGDVLMISGRDLPRGATRPDSALARGSSQLLRIAFVHVSGRQVSGAMAPYMDPTCECTVRTHFVGILHDATITGTYITRLPNGREQKGTWHVERRSRS